MISYFVSHVRQQAVGSIFVVATHAEGKELSEFGNFLLGQQLNGFRYSKGQSLFGVLVVGSEDGG